MSKSCCFIGHRKINYTVELGNKPCETIEKLITEEEVKTFYFDSRSEFDDLSMKVVTELKETYFSGQKTAASLRRIENHCALQCHV